MLVSRLHRARRQGNTNRDMLVFTRQLATLIRAGIPLRRSLRLLAEQFKGTALGDALSNTVQALEKGAKPSAAFASQSPPFDNFFISMVAVGEVKGGLYETMERIANYIEKDTRVKAKVRAALIYPGFVLTLTVVFTIATFRFLLPGILPMLTSLNGDLPWLTRTMVMAVHSVNDPLLVALELLTLTLLSLLFYRYFGMARMRPHIERFLLWFPLTRGLYVRLYTCRLAACLGALIEAHVPVVEALQHTARTLHSEVYTRDLDLAAERIRSGQLLSEHFESSRDLYLPLLVYMVLVGEKSAQVPDMLYKVAQICDQEIDHAVEVLIAMLEPGMMAALAIIVGSIIMSIFLPLYGSLQKLM
jgi:type IV pilus assembly protein PilC